MDQCPNLPSLGVVELGACWGDRVGASGAADPGGFSGILTPMLPTTAELVHELESTRMYPSMVESSSAPTRSR